ncbi:MAG: hypothetical protein JO194_01920 [Candidatus Eremiobacteraeota bacterium]|nr:hypothetical protein [Candidatus Eremiobacteraeota bacterium]
MRQQYTRDELISLLGEPVTPTMRHRGESMGTDGVWRPPPSLPSMLFACYPPDLKRDPEKLKSTSDKMFTQRSASEHIETMNEWRDARGIGCFAVSGPDAEHSDKWALFYTCPRHRSLA